MYRYIKLIIGVGNGSYIYFWKSKGLSDESIKPPITSDYSLTPDLDYFGTKTRVKFTDGKIVNVYISYEINLWNNVDSRDPTLGDSLFGAVTLVKNADIDKYKYSGYGIGFDMKGTLSKGNGFGRNCIIFGYEFFCAC